MKKFFENQALKLWSLLTFGVRQHRTVVRIGVLLVGLAVYFFFLPDWIRNFFWRGLQSNRILVNMLLIFSLLALSLVWTAGQHIDAWIFLLFNLWGPHPLWLDRAMLLITQLGNGIAALGLAIILFLLGNRLFAYQLVLGGLTLWLVVELVKFIVHRARPSIRIAQTRIVGYPAIGRSFPSGHTSQAFFLATLLAQHGNPTTLWVVFLYGVAALVGMTRLYVGAHYPRDVLAGALLGSIWGALSSLADGVLN